MKPDNKIRSAIDESLCDVRFNAQDMRSVMRGVRGQSPAPHHAPRRWRMDFAFAALALALLVLPAGMMLRARSAQPLTVVAAPGATAVPRGADVRTVIGAATVSPTAAPTAAPRALTEADAIRAARACYDAVCDTSIFTFDEFAVSAAHAPGAYTVVLESIYGNGCSFTAVIDDATGSVLRHSTPHLATSPASVSRDVPAVAQWYQKNGPLLYTWPQAEQAEFSRRYEGGALRAARPGELTEDEAKSSAAAAARDAFESLGFPGAQLFAYPMLYAERASADGAARYVVHCFAEEVTNAPAAPCVLVTLRAADGAVEDVRVSDEAK